jgi:hypothetical protein
MKHYSTKKAKLIALVICNQINGGSNDDLKNKVFSEIDSNSLFINDRPIIGIETLGKILYDLSTKNPKTCAYCGK